jgi:hypothetical protein
MEVLQTEAGLWIIGNCADGLKRIPMTTSLEKFEPN